MNGDVGIVFDHAGGIAALIAALASLVSAIGTVWNGRRALKIQQFVKEGTAVSARNENAIAEVRYDLRNGVGQAIATKAAEHLKPEIERVAVVATDVIVQKTVEAAKVAADKVEQKADEVAAVLAEKTVFDGPERRVGPTDRRETP